MKVLSIETSTLTGSVALVDGGSLLGETTLSVSAQHSERLMPAIEQLLRDASLKPSDIELYAVAVGPGSFTGLRIGIAAAQGLALAHGKPLAGVSTLQGLAMNAGGFQGIIIPALNAFRGEIYFGLYLHKNGIPVEIEGDQGAPIEEFIRRIETMTEEVFILGNGVDLFGERFKPSDRIRIASGPWNLPRAAHIGFLAEKGGVPLSRETPILPKYLRKPG